MDSTCMGGTQGSCHEESKQGYVHETMWASSLSPQQTVTYPITRLR